MFAPLKTLVDLPLTGRCGSTATPRHLPDRNSRTRNAPRRIAAGCEAAGPTTRATRSFRSATTASAERSQQSPTAPCLTSDGANVGTPASTFFASLNLGGSKRRHFIALDASEHGASSAHLKNSHFIERPPPFLSASSFAFIHARSHLFVGSLPHA